MGERDQTGEQGQYYPIVSTAMENTDDDELIIGSLSDQHLAPRNSVIPEKLSVSKEVFDFFESFNGSTVQIFNRFPIISPPWNVLPSHNQACIAYAADISMTKCESTEY